MRSLSETLLAAQKSASALPYVRVEVSDRLASVVRPRMTRLYTGSETDSPHAAAMPGDGSLIRARVDPSSSRLYIQRTADPGPSGNFSSWTYLNDVSMNANICLCSNGASVAIFYVEAGYGAKVVMRESTNYGATWGSPTAVINAALDAIKWLAAAYSAGGTLALFYASDEPRIYVMKRTGGWSNPGEWGGSASAITGVACVYQGDWNLVVTGQASGGDAKVWTCVYGDGSSQNAGTWSSLRELTTASSGSSVAFQAPFIDKPDAYRIFFVEKYTGVTAYSRVNWCHSPASATFAQNLWREPVPFNLSGDRGVAVAHGGGYLWLSTPSGVWRGSLSPGTVDLAEDVISLTAKEEPYGGELTVVLRNDDGRYASPGSGQYAPLRKGSEVRISPGYRTSAGNEASTGPAFWIEGWEYVSRGGQAQLVLHARPVWSLLDTWKARRQYAWSLGQASVLDMASFVLSRAGLDVDASGASQVMSSHKPAFTMHPGETGASALKRLMLLVPDVLLMEDATVHIKEAHSDDTAGYSYGTDHPILQGRYASSAGRVNRVQVYGSGLTEELFSWSEIDEVHDRLLQIHDINLDTSGKAQDRASAALRNEALNVAAGEIEAPANCGQQMYDVIAVTDGRAGQQGATYRVASIRLEYERGRRAVYRQMLGLSEV